MGSKEKYLISFPLTSFDIVPCASADVDGSGYICTSELGNLFREVGTPLPGYQIRELLQKLDRDQDSQISFAEFTAVGNTKVERKSILSIINCEGSERGLNFHQRNTSTMRDNMRF